MATLSQQIPLPTLVKMVEILVAWHAIWFAQELGFGKVLVEGDSKNVIDAINFYNVKRLRNNVAHRLARRVRSSHSPLVWMESIHPNFYNVYNNDLLLIESNFSQILKKRRGVGGLRYN